MRFAGDSGDGMQLIGSQFADIASIDSSSQIIREIGGIARMGLVAACRHHAARVRFLKMSLNRPGQICPDVCAFKRPKQIGGLFTLWQQVS